MSRKISSNCQMTDKFLFFIAIIGVFFSVRNAYANIKQTHKKRPVENIVQNLYKNIDKHETHAKINKVKTIKDSIIKQFNKKNYNISEELAYKGLKLIKQAPDSTNKKIHKLKATMHYYISESLFQKELKKGEIKSIKKIFNHNASAYEEEIKLFHKVKTEKNLKSIEERAKFAYNKERLKYMRSLSRNISITDIRTLYKRGYGYMHAANIAKSIIKYLPDRKNPEKEFINLATYKITTYIKRKIKRDQISDLYLESALACLEKANELSGNRKYNNLIKEFKEKKEKINPIKLYMAP